MDSDVACDKEMPKTKDYCVPLPESLGRCLAALPQDRQAAFHEQVVKMAALWVNGTPILDFRDVHLDDLDGEESEVAEGTDPLLTLVMSEARLAWKGHHMTKDAEIGLLPY